MVTTATHAPLAPWVTLADLKAMPGLANADDAVLTDAAQVATEVLWALSGRVFSGSRAATVRPYVNRACDGSRRWGTRGWDWNSDQARFDAVHGWGWCGCGTGPGLLLEQHIASITSVTIDGVVLDASAYRLDERSILVRQDGGGWPLCQQLNLPSGAVGTFEVQYVVGDTPPVGGKAAARSLAAAIYLARTTTDCKLPTRVTQIAAEGVTVVLDNFDVFRKGGTGLADVDLWVTSVNPNRLTRPAAVLSPDSIGLRRIG